MHLLFYGKEQVKLLSTKTVEQELKEQSVKVCRIMTCFPAFLDVSDFCSTGRQNLR